MNSSYTLAVEVPKQVEVGSGKLDREDFYAWVWQEFGDRGLQGVHEGTLLSEQAAQEGFETDSWTVDSGEAPRERDWVSSQSWERAEFYFASRADAEAAAEALSEVAPGVRVGEITEQKAEDWDAKWKASFLSDPGGVKIAPFWRVVPPWVERAQIEGIQNSDVVLKINPGAGFGTGTHETTQLCLRAIGESSVRRSLRGQRVLDFGAGSGILSIGAALLGATVEAVEIDELAIENALENARINGVEGQIECARYLGEPRLYPMVIANILKPVLLEFAPKLIERLEKGGTVILSGLIEKDVEPVTQAYSALLGGKKPQVYASGEWRALVWT